MLMRVYQLVVRCLDKVQRVKSFTKQGILQVEGEGVEDAFKDIIGYSLLALGMLEEANIEGNSQAEEPRLVKYLKPFQQVLDEAANYSTSASECYISLEWADSVCPDMIQYFGHKLSEADAHYSYCPTWIEYKPTSEDSDS